MCEMSQESEQNFSVQFIEYDHRTFLSGQAYDCVV